MTPSNRNVFFVVYCATGLALAVLAVFGSALTVVGPLLGVWTLLTALYGVYGAARMQGLQEGRAEAQGAVQSALEAVQEARQAQPGMEMAKMTGGGPLDGEEVPAPLAMLRTLRMMLPPEAASVAAAMACFDDEGNPIGKYVPVDGSTNVMRWVPVDSDDD